MTSGPSAGRKYAAEFLGTFLLLFAGLGAGIFLSYFDSATLTGSTVALPVNPGFIALAVGGSIAFGVYAWGNISGGHYNPGVTAAFALAGRMPRRDVLPYVVAQLLGGLTGLGVIYGVAAGYSGGGPGIARATAMGADGYAGNGSPFLFSAGAVLLFEIAASFIFYLVILLVTDKDAWKGFHGLAIGGTLAALVWAGMNVDAAGYNPARSTASAVWAAIAGIGWPGLQLWAFWIGPFVGSALAALAWRSLRAPD